MSPLTPSFRLVVITLVVGCVVASLTGAAAKERAPGDAGLKIAVVNPGRLIYESKFYKAEADAIDKIQQDALTVIRLWDQNSLLSAADQKQLGELALQEQTKAGLTAAQKTDKQALLDRGKSLFNEMLGLQTNPHPNAMENDRLREFAKLDGETKQRESAEGGRIKTQVDKRKVEMQDKINKDAKASLDKIAKKDGYNLVFSSEVVYYADNDITDKVLADLNK